MKREKTFELYKHLNNTMELEGVFASLIGIDDYMDWRRGKAANIQIRGYRPGDFYSIVIEEPLGPGFDKADKDA